MFALPQPYPAERQVFEAQPDGSMKSSWQPCRVLGVMKDEDGEPAYVVELYYRGESSLALEPYVRKVEPCVIEAVG